MQALEVDSPSFPFVQISLQSLAVLYFHNTFYILSCHPSYNGNMLIYYESHDGLHFKESMLKVPQDLQRIVAHVTVKGARFSLIHEHPALTLQLSDNGETYQYVAFMQGLETITHLTPLKDIRHIGSLMSTRDARHAYTFFYGEDHVSVAQTTDFVSYAHKHHVLAPFQDNFGKLTLSPAGAYELSTGIALFYYARGLGNTHLSLHLIVMDKKEPHKALTRAFTLWEHGDAWRGKKVRALGVALHEEELFSYWFVEGEGVHVSRHSLILAPLDEPQTRLNHYRPVKGGAKLMRHEGNPIISPLAENAWESKAAFNPAALYDRGNVHIMYRAIGDNDTSVIGYASSPDGCTCVERDDKPMYTPKNWFDTPHQVTPDNTGSLYMSGGGGHGGCEDPRVTKIDDTMYFTYVAYNGAIGPRVAMVSIHEDDFHAKNWEAFSEAKLISPPGLINKNCVLFPEKINGKYVVLHRVFPNILIDYVDSLDQFDGENFFLEGHDKIPPSRTGWDSRKVGAGAPPIKTKYGWLLIYHAVDDKDPSYTYKMGAMLLDLENPSKVLARTTEPILAPEYDYEKHGLKWGVAYPCGAVVVKDDLLIYYGGADMVTCVAKANLEEFLQHLMKTNTAQVTPVSLPN